MKTHIEFISKSFPAYKEEDDLINPGIYGKRLAEFLSSELIKCNFNVLCVFNEDWGWVIEIKNKDFLLWIGCSNYELVNGEDGFLCFIEPSKPIIRKWFKKFKTVEIVDSLAKTIEDILINSRKVTNIRWWEDSEVNK